MLVHQAGYDKIGDQVVILTRPCLVVIVLADQLGDLYSLSKKDHNKLVQQDGSLQSNPTKDFVTGGEIW